MNTRTSTRPGTHRRAWLTRGAITGLIAAAGAGPLAAAGATAAAATTSPLVSTATAELAASAGNPAIIPSSTTLLASGDQLLVTFSSDVTAAAGWSLMVTDGRAEVSLDASDATLVQPTPTSLRLTLGSGGAVGMATADLEVLSASGVTATAGGSWNLVASGEVSRVDASSGTATCSTVGVTRVFGGSNCDIGLGAAGGPIPPDVFDVIAVATTDLVGPPLDGAPEVITNCGGGSTDTVYDLVTGTALGSQACGVWPSGEGQLGNTTSSSLDYIPTPTLASYEQVGVVETLPGSLYVSPTGVPPQLTGISVSGATATFSYDTPVTCQDQTGGPATVSQFSYASPWWNTGSAADLVFASSISCPPPAGASSITVTFPGAVPDGVRFKFEGYGQNAFIVAGTGSPFAGEREASQSAYAGSSPLPAPPSVASLQVDPASPAIGSQGGQVQLDFTTANAARCAVSVSGSATVQLRYRDTSQSAQPLGYALTAPAASAEVPCPDGGTDGIAEVQLGANPSTSVAASYTVTLTATGLPGVSPSSASTTLDLSVPPAAAPPPPPPPAAVASATPVTTAPASPGPASAEPASTPLVLVAARPQVLSLAPSKARPAGRVWVRVRGTGFAPHDTVRFGRRLALRVRVMSSHMLVVLCPPGRGTVRVTVHTATGTSLRVARSTFRYLHPVA